MLPQPRSSRSQLCKFWGLAHFKHPWAVSQPCVSTAVSSVLNSHGWEKRQMLLTSKSPPRKKSVFTSVSSKVVDCMHIPPVPAWGNVLYPKRTFIIHAHVTSKAVTSNSVHVKTWLSCLGYTEDIFLDSGSLRLSASSSTLQREQFL